MANPCVHNERFATITGSAYSVRACLNGTETVYCLRDILEICGIKHQCRWMSHNREFGGGNGFIKLPFPFETQCGRRFIKMNFAGSAAVEMVLRQLVAPAEVKAWIKTNVLTYKIAPEPKKTEAKKELEVETASKGVATESNEAINRRIDSILLELFELKKALLAQNEANVATA